MSKETAIMLAGVTIWVVSVGLILVDGVQAG